MLEAFGHFSFELGCAIVGAALLSAGIAALIAKPSFIIEKIPLIGAFIASIRIGLGVMLVGGGCFALGAGAGYFHRGTLDQSAALEDQIKAEKALKTIAENRAKAFDEARKKAEKSADELADQITALTKQASEDDERSLAHDSDSCLAADGVQRLNSIGRREGRR